MPKYAYFMPCGKISKRLKSLENTRFYDYDTSIVRLPRQDLKRPKEMAETSHSLASEYLIYTPFTPFEGELPDE